MSSVNFYSKEQTDNLLDAMGLKAHTYETFGALFNDYVTQYNKGLSPILADVNNVLIVPRYSDNELAIAVDTVSIAFSSEILFLGSSYYFEINSNSGASITTTFSTTSINAPLAGGAVTCDPARNTQTTMQASYFKLYY